MINITMVKNDLASVLNQDFSHDLKIAKSGEVIKCHFNQNSKIIYSDGAVGTELTALVLADSQNLKVKDEVIILQNSYEITKITLESQVLKRLFLRKI